MEPTNEKVGAVKSPGKKAVKKDTAEKSDYRKNSAIVRSKDGKIQMVERK